jgi:hypothetical protein
MSPVPVPVSFPDEHELASLVGREFPPGDFEIDPDAHRRAIAALHVGPWDSPTAHPVYGHIALNGGMGITREDFFALCGSTLRTGALFGRGVITWHQPMLIGSRYTVRSRITSTERKTGRRSGTFDLVTVRLDADDEYAASTASMDETYVFLRSTTGG